MPRGSIRVAIRDRKSEISPEFSFLPKSRALSLSTRRVSWTKAQDSLLVVLPKDKKNPEESAKLLPDRMVDPRELLICREIYNFQDVLFRSPRYIAH